MPQIETTAHEEVAALMSFTSPAARWTAVNDDVMGGYSRGRGELPGDVLVFTGELSRANGGGFASIRSPELELDLAGWRGLELRVRGDGRTYRLGARYTNGRHDVRTWRAEFETLAGEWQTVRVPFKDMALSIRGRCFDWDRLLDPSGIRCLSILIADGDDSRAFGLEVARISKYR